MKENDKLPKSDYTEDELDDMGEVLLKADKIRRNSVLFRAVQQHLSSKVPAIKRISDLRDKMANEDITDKGYEEKTKDVDDKD